MENEELRKQIEDDIVIAIGMYHKFMIEHPIVREAFYFFLIGCALFLVELPLVLFILGG